MILFRQGERARECIIFRGPQYIVLINVHRGGGSGFSLICARSARHDDNRAMSELQGVGVRLM